MFEKFNKQYQNTVKEGIDTDSMEFVKLKEFEGKTIKVDGFFFVINIDKIPVDLVAADPAENNFIVGFVPRFDRKGALASKLFIDF